MLLQSEILRIAEKESVPPDTIDKNWVLDCSDLVKQTGNNSLRDKLGQDDFPDVNQVINELETIFSKTNWH